MELAIFVSVLSVCSFTIILLAFKRRYQSAQFLCLGTILYTRYVRHLGPDVQWHHDSYFYFLTTRAIQETGRLAATDRLSYAWPIIENRLDRFVLPLFSYTIGEVTGLNNVWLRLSVPPLFGVVLFFVALVISKRYLPREWAIIASFVYLMLDAVIVHHIQFHQQAIGTLFLLLFATPILLKTIDKRLYGLSILFGVLLLFSHVATPFLGVIVLIGIAGASVLGYLVDFSDTASRLKLLSQENRVILLYLFVTLLFSAYLYPEYLSHIIVRTLSFDRFSYSIFGGGGGGSIGYQINESRTLLNYIPSLTKVYLGIFAIAATYLAVRYRKHRELLPVLLFGAMSVLTIVLGVVLFSSAVVGRILEFGYLFAVIASCYSLHFWFEKLDQHKMKQFVAIFVMVSLLVMVVGNALIAVNPSRIDPTSNVAADGYGDVEPIGTELRHSGTWFYEYGPVGRNYYTVYKPRAAVYYYGVHSATYLYNAEGPGYILNDVARSPGIGDRVDRIYTNGRLTVSYGDPDRATIE